ncbi:uncharacterized protein VTP21DRAFT_9351 [Calcarisporiella thermophila]|uniref:uncharacterized protein n=1 Tax=Calcarisporiella thermophila TaxID=911321 RepID=UPI003744A233
MNIMNDRDMSADDPDASRMDLPIPSTNIGFRMLMKMGWDGRGLGRTSQGRTDPIPIELKEDSLGIGKKEEDEVYHQLTTAKRKTLEGERVETEEERLKREEKAQKQEAIRKEVQAIKAAFFCELCQKQYSRISEYDQHLSSYDHHHRKRLKELKDASRPAATDKRREKEKRREEKELARIQAMAAQKI